MTPSRSPIFVLALYALRVGFSTFTCIHRWWGDRTHRTAREQFLEIRVGRPWIVPAATHKGAVVGNLARHDRVGGRKGRHLGVQALHS